MIFYQQLESSKWKFHLALKGPRNKFRLLTTKSQGTKTKLRWQANILLNLMSRLNSLLLSHHIFRSLIGLLRRIIELGHSDITMEASATTTKMAVPREGHLKAALQIFAFLTRSKHKSLIVFNPTIPDTTNLLLTRNIGLQLNMVTARKFCLMHHLPQDDLAS